MSGRLHKPAEPAPVRIVLFRVSLLLGIILVTSCVLYFEGGLVDHRTGEHPDLAGTIYFTMVTITTVGYGDIVPETTFARLIDAFFLTPVRGIVFILFVGIAYELSLQRLQEGYRMSRLVSRLHNHVIVCGYGETGRVTVRELLLQGIDPEQIVVLDIDRLALDDAAMHGVVTVFGNASEERVLRSVAVEKAAHIVVCPGRDDTTVLIALTAQALNPNAQLVALCHDRENVKLIQRSGAHTIIAPAGGNLAAAATRRPHLVATMQDMLQLSGELFIDERRVHPEEVGKRPNELKEMAVVRVYRQGKHYNVCDFPELKTGDVLVFVTATRNSELNEAKPQ